ncbi:MAG: RNA polymerase sigma factor [Muribaculaceae bacterium]|nr:RNA polymerase sigma factor [Muribaculaceae bacterium]
MRNETFQTRLIGMQRNLLNFALSLTSNRDDAYDLLQDTTLKALDNEDKYVDNVNFKGWVFTIMRNLFINRYRQTVRTNVILDRTDDLMYLNMSQDSGYETPEGAINARQITTLLNNFEEAYRRPLSMFIAGYKYTEIAEHMHLPLGTVKSRIFLARKRLQKQLGDDCYD